MGKKKTRKASDFPERQALRLLQRMHGVDLATARVLLDVERGDSDGDVEDLSRKRKAST